MSFPRKKNLLVYGLLPVMLALMVSCRSNQVLVKFRNESDEDFTQVDVRIFDSTFHLYNLRSGRGSQFIRVKQTYTYCAMRVITERDTIRLEPAVFLERNLFRKGKLAMNIYILPFRYKRHRLLELRSKKIGF